MSYNHIYTVSELKKLCEHYSLLSSVAETNDYGSDWVIDNAKIFNRKSDYFSIGLYRVTPTSYRFLMEQKQHALVVLLVADIDGLPAAILNFRFEPGLVGRVNLTATIQSTPNNYLQLHGGKPTPFIEIIDNPDRYDKVIYDELQYDWGNYYIGKIKRYLIIKLKNPPEKLESGFCWFHFDTVRELLLEDNLITNDLRVCISQYLGSIKTPISKFSYSPVTESVKRLERVPLSIEFSDSVGNRISFFGSETQTREVASWVQPLIVPALPVKINLIFTHFGNKKLFAVEQKTQVGLLGKKLWFPANITGEYQLYHQVWTCAEGGRFWRYLINIEVLKLKNQPLPSNKIVWLSEDELFALILQPLITSLELRLAWSIAIYQEETCDNN